MDKMLLSATSKVLILLAFFSTTLDAQTFTDCGGIYEGPKGAIVSPRYPSSYPNNAACSWTITAKANEIINLKFTLLDLDGYADSCPDVVNIFDGDSSRAPCIQQLCRNKDNDELETIHIRSTGNKMFVTFSSDAINQMKGFFGTYWTHVCLPLKYGPETCNTDCDCNSVNTAYCDNLSGKCYCKPGWTGATCDKDIDECADHQVERCPFDYKYCSNINGGYTCKCQPGLEERGNGCSGESDCTLGCEKLCGVDDSGISHCYCPDNMALNGQKCEVCSAMTFGKNCARTCRCNTANTDECDSVTGQCKCKTGWTGADCSVDVDECQLTAYVSTCNAAQNLHCFNFNGGYRCDCLRGYATEVAGGKCEKIPCLHTVETSGSTVQTVDFPNAYWPNAVCSWLIKADLKSTVSVQLKNFQTQSLRDVVAFFDGPDTSSSLLGVFSGTVTFSAPVRSTKNNMLIQFTSDNSVEYAGFTGTYTINTFAPGCSEILTAQKTNKKFGSYFASRKTDVFCKWLITAPSGSIISINFQKVVTDPSINNPMSFVAVYKGTHAGDPIVAKYSGIRTPGVIRIPGPNVYVVYQSEENIERDGFTATYNYCPPFSFGSNLCTEPCICIQSKSVSCDSFSGECLCKPGWTSSNCYKDIDECRRNPCSLTEKCVNTEGSYYCVPDCDLAYNTNKKMETLGEITTVQYPGYSLYNAKCSWKIYGGANEIVTLQFEPGNFQLTESAYCSLDSLNIYDGVSNPKNQIGRYCGTRIPSIIRSTSSTMTLQLYTSSRSRRGFTGLFYTHECPDLKWGTTCNKDCNCEIKNTLFCDNIDGGCVCKGGWTGESCKEDVNECRTGICHNNEECKNIDGGYECKCIDGFTKNVFGICEASRENCVLPPNDKPCSSGYCVHVNGKVSCLCLQGFIAIPTQPEECAVTLYPYGDNDIPVSENSFGEITFNEYVPFGSDFVNKAYVNRNGVISFEKPDSSRSQSDSAKLLYIFKSKTSDTASEEVKYRLYEKCGSSAYLGNDKSSSADKQLVFDRAALDVVTFSSCADFDVHSVLVATYINFKKKNQAPNIKNTFQAVFISGYKKERSSDQDFSSEKTSYVIYLYPKHLMQWCNKDILIGTNSETLATSAQWHTQRDFKQKYAYLVGTAPAIDPIPKCEIYLCKNLVQIRNEKYQVEMEQLYKCPCTLDRLGLQWTFYDQLTPNVYCFTINLAAKRKLLSSNSINKLCCYRWNKPADNSNWQVWAEQLSVATFVHNSPDAGHIIPRDPDSYQVVRENINAHQWCCKDANKAELCERFNKIYPDTECSYDVEFVPAYLLGDPTIVTLDNVTYLMNGWGEYTLMDVPSENFSLQARTDRIQTSKGLSNGTVFTGFAAKDGYGTHFQVELSAARSSMEILAKGLNLTDNFYRQVNYRFSIEDIEVKRDNSGNKTKVIVSFPCGVSFIVRVGVKNLELEMQVLKALKGKTKGLLGNFNGKTNDEFTLPNGTVLPSNIKESQIFYSFARHYQVTANTSVFMYKKGKKAADFQHPTFIPVFMDTLNASILQAAVKLCGVGRTACIYDYFITKDSAFAKNSDTAIKESRAKRLLLENSCPNVTVARNVNYTNGRWFVQEGLINVLRANATDQNQDALNYLISENFTGVSINQSGFILYTPSSKSPVKIGFRVKDSKNCYTPVVNIRTTICPKCRNNGSCNINKIREVEYFGGQIQILKCDCPPAYTGDNCESELDACLAKPCAKGKTCTDLSAAQQGNSTVGYICGPCPTGFQEIEEFCFDVDECENNMTCDHKCENTEGSFACLCNDGYVLNRTDSRSCLAKNCSNRCIMQNTWYCDETVSVCVCKDDIRTPDCFTVIDHCVSNPCPSNRKCISKDVGFECTCMNGFQPVNGTCSDCGRVLTDSSGSFMSTNYPDNYPSEESCTLTITSNYTNTIILLNFTDYQVEGCPYDYLEIYDGSSFESDIIGQFCISGITEPISSSGNSLFISFISDSTVNRKGFLATYIMESQCRIKQCSHGCKMVSASPRIEQCLCPDWARLDVTETTCLEINACNSTVSNNTGIIVSPGYPKKYQINSSCHWTIPSKAQSSVIIRFSEMDIEGGVSCPYDSLKIYNGTSPNVPLLGVYCGSSLPRSISSSNSLYLVFTSDGLITGRGFKLQYIYELNQVIPLRPPADVTV